MNKQSSLQMWVLIAASLIIASQLTIVFALVSFYLPYKPDPLLNQIFYHYRTGFMPERELPLYMTAIVVACACFIGLVIRFSHQLKQQHIGDAWLRYCLVHAGLISVQVITSFFITVSHGALWAWGAFYLFLALACLANIFWPEINSWLGRGRWRINFPAVTLHQNVAFMLPPVLALQCILILDKFFSLGVSSAGLLFIILGAFALKAVLIIKPPRTYLYVEVLITGLLLHAWVQQHTYPLRPMMAQGAFNVLVILAVGVKVFYQPLVNLVNKFIYRLKQYQQDKRARFILDSVAVLFIFLIIFIPDRQAVIAQFFLGDYFHTWDVVFMGAVYAISQGMTPGVDVNATYGLGITVFLAWMTKLLGGFDYVHVLTTLVTLGIVYFVAWYLLLRKIFKSQLLAIAAIILGIRAQMFLGIVAPMVWNEAQASVLRYAVDVLFFWCLWLLVTKDKKIFLWAMVILAGFSIFYMPTTGIFLGFITGLYVALVLLKEYVAQGMLSKERVFYLARPLIFIPVAAFTFYSLTVGDNIVRVDFWARILEWTSYFSHGFFYQPIFYALQFHEYTKVVIGLLIPVFYLATAFYTGYRYCTSTEKRDDILICLMAIYGLGLFTYYIGMSHKYYSVALPAIFILFYWIDRAMPLIRQAWHTRIKVILLMGVTYCLLTTHMFMAYPNLLNWSSNPVLDPKVSTKVSPRVDYFHQLSVDFPDGLKLPLNSLGKQDEDFRFEKDFINQAALISYYKNETAFSEDAALIKQLTSPQERIALLSSFEVMILSKANRKPFFYYFPLLNSHPMRMRNFVVTTIFSYPQLISCLKQLDNQKPPYVFMEKIFLTEQVPAWYGQQFEDLINIIQYVRQHYEPYAAGKYLVAMKLKEVK